MKVLLAALMCVVLTMTEAFAISGGPWSGSGHVTVTGTYAGVFVPVPIVNPTPPPATLTDNSLILFTLKIPQTGLGSGTVAAFRNGKFYTGAIQASADPDSALVSGTISAIHTQSVTTPTSIGSTTLTIIYNDLANGILKAKANSNVSTFGGTRLKGRESYIIYKDDPTDPTGDPTPTKILYQIKGFKQSEST